MIALVLLAIQIMAYAAMEGKPDYMHYAPVLSDSHSIAQWLGNFVGSNLFSLVGIGLLLFANTGKRGGTSNAEQVEIVREEPLVNVPGPQDDEDVVWEELKEWPEGADGTDEQEKNEQR